MLYHNWSLLVLTIRNIQALKWLKIIESPVVRNEAMLPLTRALVLNLQGGCCPLENMKNAADPLCRSARALSPEYQLRSMYWNEFPGLYLLQASQMHFIN